MAGFRNKLKSLSWIRAIILAISIIFFVLGLAYPILYTKKHLIGLTLSSQDVWLFTSIKFFFSEQEYLLGVILLLFTVIFPIFKYFELINRLLRIVHVGPRISQILSYSDKWSMLDVFIIALLIMNYKMDSSIVSMEIRIGTTFFAISILLRMVVCNIIKVKHKLITNRIHLP